MERSDLLSANGGIFRPQGKALNDSAKRDVKVLVVGNPANTNALIAQSQRPPRPPAVHGHDPPRPQPGGVAAGGQARRAGHRRQPHGHLGQPLDDAVPEPVPLPGGRQERLRAVGDHEWVDGTFIPTVAKRGAAIIEARGASSAASAANAAIDHMRSWALGTPRATGSPWPCARTAATASPRA